MEGPSYGQENAEASMAQTVLFLSAKVLDGSAGAGKSAMTDENDVVEGSCWLPFADNASLRCPTSVPDLYENDVCEEQSIQRLIWRVLYWL